MPPWPQCINNLCGLAQLSPGGPYQHCQGQWDMVLTQVEPAMINLFPYVSIDRGHACSQPMYVCVGKEQYLATTLFTY